ncbi:hypothetical protein [Bacteroides sp.]|uniref:hypothetical protein n=1 Tax=Bacteroides TaxID=816 RepID=UPI0025B974B0|nr:hypothetical protein [Bacteroides sp.]
MSNLTQSGFPKDIHTLPEFLCELQKHGADIQLIPIHCSSEPGTGNLHQLMWDAYHQGYIEMDRSLTDPVFNAQFRVKLRLNAIAYLESRTEARLSSRRSRTSILQNWAILILTLITLILTVVFAYKNT